VKAGLTVAGWHVEASLSRSAHGGFPSPAPEPERPRRTHGNALKLLDEARFTLDRVGEVVPDLFAMGAPGSPAGAAAVLAGFATTLGREADALLASGNDSEGERLVFLLSDVLDAMDFVGHIGAA
jgi:hypothetical protein